MLHRSEFRAMGSKMLALVESEAEPSTLAAVPAWFEEWEQILSRFRSDSELSQLNMAAGSRRPVSEVFWEVFASAVEASDLTGGLVTPVILDALLSAGYDEPFDKLRLRHDLEGPSGTTFLLAGSAPALTRADLSDIGLEPATRSLTLPFGARLDFGGIAKGWAAEQAVRRLLPYGPALVSAGGDISVTGPRSGGEAWKISVDDPFNPGGSAEYIFLSGGGVATSGKDRRRWMRAGLEQHHIIDPRTGLPALTDVLTATVIAPSAVQAEAMAKAVLISGSQRGLDWLDHSPDFAGMLILDNGQRLYSRSMEQFL